MVLGLNPWEVGVFEFACSPIFQSKNMQVRLFGNSKLPDLLIVVYLSQPWQPVLELESVSSLAALNMVRKLMA